MNTLPPSPGRWIWCTGSDVLVPGHRSGGLPEATTSSSMEAYGTGADACLSARPLSPERGV